MESTAVNVLENEKNYHIEIVALGMAKGNFSVRLENYSERSINLERKSEDKNVETVKVSATRGR